MPYSEPGSQTNPPTRSRRYRWLVRGLALAYLAVVVAAIVKALL